MRYQPQLYTFGQHRSAVTVTTSAHARCQYYPSTTLCHTHWRRTEPLRYTPRHLPVPTRGAPTRTVLFVPRFMPVLTPRLPLHYLTQLLRGSHFVRCRHATHDLPLLTLRARRCALGIRTLVCRARLGIYQQDWRRPACPHWFVRTLTPLRCSSLFTRSGRLRCAPTPSYHMVGRSLLQDSPVYPHAGTLAAFASTHTRTAYPPCRSSITHPPHYTGPSHTATPHPTTHLPYACTHHRALPPYHPTPPPTCGPPTLHLRLLAWLCAAPHRYRLRYARALHLPPTCPTRNRIPARTPAYGGCLLFTAAFARLPDVILCGVLRGRCLSLPATTKTRFTPHARLDITFTTHLKRLVAGLNWASPPLPPDWNHHILKVL